MDPQGNQFKAFRLFGNAICHILRSRTDQQSIPTEADVWKHPRENGLVVEVHDHNDKEAEEFLDNEYRVLPCDKDGEDPERNEREAREAALTVPFVKV